MKRSHRRVVVLDGETLTLEQVEAIALGQRCRLDASATRRVRAGRRAVDKDAGRGMVYGVNTGFGQLAEVRVDDARLEELQQNLIRSHSAGTGAPLPEPLVRAILAQVGRPMRVCEAGEWTSLGGWSAIGWMQPRITGRRAIAKRYVSPIGAPDLQIFPAFFRARTVRFRAGLELAVMHLGLRFLAWLVRLGLMRSAAWAASFCRTHDLPPSRARAGRALLPPTYFCTRSTLLAGT